MTSEPEKHPSRITEAEFADAPKGMAEDSLLSFDPRRTVDGLGEMERAMRAETLAVFTPSESMGSAPGELAFWSLESSEATSGGSLRPATMLLRERIGQGGFGEVWAAEQTSLRRTVALKRLRPDLLTGDKQREQSLERMFRQEAITAARLDHPNIVPVHDLGRDEAGRPVLAMKRVVGQPWDRMIYADFPRDSPADFLAKHLPILIAVGQAVSFAHSRGVVHRDLKPSQAMVGEFGEVLLMDWGLAVHRYAPETERLHPLDAFDESCTFPAGTPAFMAPEQTDASGERLGPWTDVYLLGGTLYYLLTGLPPHQGSSRTAFRKAQMGDVALPSEIAPERTHPPELVLLAMRALRPRIGDRVPSAKDFVLGIQDYLSGSGRRRESQGLSAAAQLALSRGPKTYGDFAACLATLEQSRALWLENPDVAAPMEEALARYADSAITNGDLTLAREQVGRLAASQRRDDSLRALAAAEARALSRERQRRFAASLAVALFLVVACLAAWTETQRREAVRQKALADSATREAELQKSNAIAQANRAVAARGQADRLLQFMLVDLGEKLNRVGQLPILDAVSDEALAYFSALEGEDATPASKLGLAGTLREIATIRISQGRMDEAEKVYRQSLEIITEQRALGAERKTADLGEIQTCYGLASLMLDSERTEEAAPLLERGLALAEGLVATEPNNAEYVGTLAVCHKFLGALAVRRGNSDEGTAHRERGITLFRKALTIDPEDAGWADYLADALHSTAGSYVDSGDFPKALAYLREAEAYYVKRSEDYPGEIQPLASLSIVRSAIAETHMEQGNTTEAETVAESALVVLERLVLRDPTNHEWRDTLASTQLRTGDIERELRHYEAAVEHYKAAAETVGQLAEAAPDRLEWRLASASIRGRIGQTLLVSGDSKAAAVAMGEAVAAVEMLAEADPETPRWRRNVAVGRMTHAEALLASGEPDRALELARRAAREIEALAEGDPRNTPLRVDLGDLSEQLARMFSKTRDRESAIAANRASIAAYDTAAESDAPRARLLAAEARLALAQRFVWSCDDASAAAEIASSTSALRALVERDPEDAASRTTLARASLASSELARRAGNAPEAKVRIEAAFALLPTTDSERATSLRKLATSLELLLRADAAKSNAAESRRLADEALAALPAETRLNPDPTWLMTRARALAYIGDEPAMREIVARLAASEVCEADLAQFAQP